MLCATTECNGEKQETVVFVSHEHKCGCTYFLTHTHTYTHTHTHTRTHTQNHKHNQGQAQAAQGNVVHEKDYHRDSFLTLRKYQ